MQARPPPPKGSQANGGRAPARRRSACGSKRSGSRPEARVAMRDPRRRRARACRAGSCVAAELGAGRADAPAEHVGGRMQAQRLLDRGAHEVVRLVRASLAAAATRSWTSGWRPSRCSVERQRVRRRGVAGEQEEQRLRRGPPRCVSGRPPSGSRALAQPAQQVAASRPRAAAVRSRRASTRSIVARSAARVASEAPVARRRPAQRGPQRPASRARRPGGRRRGTRRSSAATVSGVDPVAPPSKIVLAEHAQRVLLHRLRRRRSCCVRSRAASARRPRAPRPRSAPRTASTRRA